MTAVANNRKYERNGAKSEKVFKNCDSLLTVASSGNFRVIKNFYYALLASYIIRELIIYFIQSKPSTFGFDLLIQGFKKSHFAIPIWILLFALHLSVVPIFRLWAYLRAEISPIFTIKKTYDILALVILISYYLCSIYFIGKIANGTNLGYIGAMIIHLENVRFLMKAYSFIRTNAPKVLKHKQHSDQILELPRMSSYLYFSFAPTLLYRDEYPRRKQIDRKFACKCFFEMLCFIWVTSFILKEHFMELQRDAGLIKMDWKDFTVLLFQNFLYGAHIAVFIFYVMTHCWYNGMGEILRFADRNFYDTWWLSTSYSDFYRKWNIPVQDWLHIYIYKEIKCYASGNAALAKLGVLFLSAVAHEYIMSSILQQTVPLIFLIMVFLTLPLAYVKGGDPCFNTPFILSIVVALNLLTHFNYKEHQTRINCPPAKSDIWSQYLPRLFTTDCL